jgi:hypothetical protein
MPRLGTLAESVLYSWDRPFLEGIPSASTIVQAWDNYAAIKDTLAVPIRPYLVTCHHAIWSDRIMMMDDSGEWFESVLSEGKRIPHISKFSRKDFIVSAEVVEARWTSWTAEEKGKFASAFSQRLEMDDNDERVLDLLMDKGDPPVWHRIALAVARHRNRSRALNFLLARVMEREGSVANYYQALGKMLASECVPILQQALLKHREDTDLHPFLQAWQDRFIYLDYLSCSATLFAVTGREEYRENLREMLRHPEEAVRNMVRMISSTQNIACL